MTRGRGRKSARSLSASAFAASGVQGMVIGYPPDFSGHGAGNGNNFPRKYGACIHAFIETGERQAPCL